MEAQFIFTGTSRHTEKDFRSYLQYLEYLNQNRPAPNAYELFAKGYEDYLQSPLQVSKCFFVLIYLKCVSFLNLFLSFTCLIMKTVFLYPSLPFSHSWITWSLRHMKCLKRIL